MKNDCKLNPRLVSAILWRDAGATSRDVVGSRTRMSDEFAQDGVNIGVKNGKTTTLRGSEDLMNYTAAADPEHGSGWRRGKGGKGEMIRGCNPRELHGHYTLCEICNVTIGDLSS